MKNSEGISLLIFFFFRYLVQIGPLEVPVFTHCSFSEGDFQDVSSCDNAQASNNRKEESSTKGESVVSAVT